MMSFYDVDGRMGAKSVWDLLDWNKHRRIVSRIQTRIVKAVETGLKEVARDLQRMLSNSLSAKLIAIKRVIPDKPQSSPSVGDIFRKYGETFRSTHRLHPRQHKVMYDIELQNNTP